MTTPLFGRTTHPAAKPSIKPRLGLERVEDRTMPASVGGFVWNDADHNGVINDAEEGVPSVTIRLLDSSGAVSDETQTDPLGGYLFGGVAPGDYRVQVGRLANPADLQFTDPHQGSNPYLDSDVDMGGTTAPFPVAADDIRLDQSAGLWSPDDRSGFAVVIQQLRDDAGWSPSTDPAPTGPGTITGRAWLDTDGDGFQEESGGVANVAVELLTADGRRVTGTTTSASGDYTLPNVAPGDYTVVFTVPSGLRLTSPGSVPVEVPVGEAVTAGVGLIAVGAAPPPPALTLEQQLVVAADGPKAPIADEAGPDVTDWFARDLVDQIEVRAKAQQRIAMTGRLPGILGGPVQVGTKAAADLLQFGEQAAHLMAAKWMDFGGPKTGKGVHTVTLEGRGIRKNQLGNIAFGLIADLLPPSFYENPVRFAYRKQAVNQYDPTHPYADAMFGKFKGTRRADNLAAFGVGHGIAVEIRKLPIFKTIQDRISDGKGSPILTAAERSEFVTAVRNIVRTLLNDDTATKRRVNRYVDLWKDKTGIDHIDLNTLYLIPFGGGDGTVFTNTLTVDKTKPPYNGPLTSAQYFEQKVRLAYAAYQKAEQDAGRPPLDLDQWLRVYLEDYSQYEQKK